MGSCESSTSYTRPSGEWRNVDWCASNGNLDTECNSGFDGLVIDAFILVVSGGVTLIAFCVMLCLRPAGTVPGSRLGRRCMVSFGHLATLGFTLLSGGWNLASSGNDTRTPCLKGAGLGLFRSGRGGNALNTYKFLTADLCSKEYPYVVVLTILYASVLVLIIASMILIRKTNEPQYLYRSHVILAVITPFYAIFSGCLLVLPNFCSSGNTLRQLGWHPSTGFYLTLAATASSWIILKVHHRVNTSEVEPTPTMVHVGAPYDQQYYQYAVVNGTVLPQDQFSSRELNVIHQGASESPSSEACAVPVPHDSNVDSQLASAAHSRAEDGLYRPLLSDRAEHASNN